MFKNPLAIARFVVENGTSLGASMVVVAVLRANVPTANTVVVKALQAVGIYGLSGVSGALAAQHTTTQFDQIVAMINGAPEPKKD